MALSDPRPPEAVDDGAGIETAARLLAADRAGLGGIWLRTDDGDAGLRAVDLVCGALPRATVVRIVPATVDDERLFGGLDIGATLEAGRPVHRAGLLAEAANGLLVLRSAERLPPAIAARLAAAVDAMGRSAPALLMIDHGAGDEWPSAALLERVAIHLVAPAADMAPPDVAPATVIEAVAPLDAELVVVLAEATTTLGIGSMRAARFAMTAARASAAVAGRGQAEATDVALAARLVLGPRATRWPEPPPPPPDDTPPPSKPDDDVRPLEDVVLDAARAAVPADLLAAVIGLRERRGATGSGGGNRRAAPQRGRRIGVRPGLPRGGARLALVETLRAAAPWQSVREARGGNHVRLRRDDLRVRRFEDRADALAVFAVDASGSSARARLAEAKGAVELLLAQAYARRIEVALVAFRGTASETLLPPTRSLTRARRLLAELPGGGGTPLAAGLDRARMLAEAGRARGRTPHIVVLTDGRANVTADGRPDRGAAEREATAAARRLKACGIRGTLIDIGPRRQPEAAALAAAMGARYLHLPRADASAVHSALAM